MDSERKRAANTREANLIENNLEKSVSVDPLTLAFNLPGEDDHLRAPWSHEVKGNIPKNIRSRNSHIKLNSSKQQQAPIFSSSPFITSSEMWEHL